MKKPNTLIIAVNSTFLIVFALFCFSSCKKQKSGIAENLIEKIGEGNALDAELVFECTDPLVALDSDKEGNFYLASYNGDILKVSKSGKADTIYSGVKPCGFSLTSLTVLPEGDLITNDCVDDKDVLFRVYKKGGRSKVAEIDGNVLSLAYDNSRRVLVGSWVSEGNLTVEFNPNRLSAAEYIAGKILEVDEDGNVSEISEGGLPMCIKSDRTGNLYAAIWGGKGGFEAEAKSYSVADLRHIFWITLSEDVKIISVNGEKTINTGDLKSISSFEFLDDGTIVVQAIPEIGGAGLYLLKEGSDPIELMFNQEKIEASITGLEFSNGSLYFINVEGKLYKIK
jgi:hypothetical protein